MRRESFKVPMATVSIQSGFPKTFQLYACHPRKIINSGHFRPKNALKVKVAQSCLTFCHPWTVQSMGFSRPEYWNGQPFPSPGDLPNPQIEPRSPTLQADSLPSEQPGKPKNTGVGSLSLLQGISPTQESNQGILHYRQILYQLSYQGQNLNFKENVILLRQVRDYEIRTYNTKEKKQKQNPVLSH